MSGPTDSSTVRPVAVAGGYPLSPTEEATRRWRLMDRVVELLIQKSVTGEYWPEAYQRALDVLESLPLETNDFAIAVQRQENARRYAASGEFGAAAFELRQLRGLLSA